MPLVRISLIKGRTPAEVRAIADAVHQALVETFDVPEHDRFQMIEQLDPDALIYDPGYLGIDRTDRIVVVSILASNTRPLEAKQALYAAIASKVAATGTRPQDVQVILTPNERADWSFGNGMASYVPAPAG